MDPLYYRDWTGSAGAACLRDTYPGGHDWGKWHSDRVMGAEYLHISSDAAMGLVVVAVDVVADHIG